MPNLNFRDLRRSKIEERTKEEEGQEEEPDLVPTPGTVAVPGVQRRTDTDQTSPNVVADGQVGDHDLMVPIEQQDPEFGADCSNNRSDSNVTATADSTLDRAQGTVKAYLVSDTEPVLAHATVTPQSSRVGQKYVWTVFLCLFVVISTLAIGLAVGLTKSSPSASASTTTNGDETDSNQKLLVSFLVESQMNNGRHYSDGRVFTRAARDDDEADDDEEASYVVEGSQLLLYCHVPECTENDGACKVGNDIFEEGCCLGMDCDDESKCGEQCPPDACTPDFEGCTHHSCFTCRKDSRTGDDIFSLYRYNAELLCVDYGRENLDGNTTQVNDSHSTGGINQGSYDWAIACWRVVAGGKEKQNLGNGEFQCDAYRQGAGILPESQSMSFTVPCQYIQLGECGCAPSDVHTFGLDAPTKPCQTHDDCPFLCSDAPSSDFQSLCEAFEGIKWWEGQNFMGMDLFTLPDNRTVELTIYK